MKKLLFLFTLLLPAAIVTAQDLQIPGRLSGSFETTTQLYSKDTVIKALVPQDKIGSNNYLKLDYTHSRFSGGLQAESYLPSVAGYPVVLNETKIINRYFKYTTERLSIQAGDFYEQFGNGLIFRAWENRQIGINNAVEGVNIQASPVAFIRMKAIYGRQRMGFERAASNLRGIDATIDLTQIKPSESENPLTAQLGMSYVSRYQEYTGPDLKFPSTVNAWSARMDLFRSIASLSVEYVHKSADPQIDNSYSHDPGMGLLVNGSLTFDRAGVNMTFRSLNNMSFRGERDVTGVFAPVNYIPALTKHHEFMVTNIYVYNPQPRGEMGGQIDLFLNVGEINTQEGKYGSDIAVNLSWYGGLKGESALFAYTDDYFRDASIEWKKKWSRKLKTDVQLQYLFYNKSVIEGGTYDNINANTVVLGMLYNYTTTKSCHVELQHLYTEQDHKSWAAMLVEMNFAPRWSFFLSDLYNYGLTEIHYPTAGGYYSFGSSRLGLSYGRQRAGLLCVGGVCRYVPASTGFTLTLTTTFN